MPATQTTVLFMISELALNVSPGPAILFPLSRCIREAAARQWLRPWPSDGLHNSGDRDGVGAVSFVHIFAACLRDVFHSAAADLGMIASSARPRPEELADKAFDSLTRNGYGQFDHLIQTLQPALGAT
jgi:hypothetical protein